MRHPRNGERQARTRQRDMLQVASRSEDAVAPPRPAPAWPPVPDLFDVITYFRARGDSFTLIASIGFWIDEDRKKALTARGLKLWYEAELDRRVAAKAMIR
jgi:hypothetical protein